jgi:vancomycin resistance protein YoaR
MIAKLQPKRIFFYTILTICLLLFIIAAGNLGYVLLQEQKLTNRIYPQVFIDNKDVGGKTKNEAKQLFKGKKQTVGNVSLTVLYKEIPIATFSAQQLNLHSNADEIIDRAYLVGRSTHIPSRIKEKIFAILGLARYDFSTGIAYNPTDITEFLLRSEEQYNTPAKNALFTFEEGKVVSFKPDEKGVKLNTEHLRRDIDMAINSLDTKTRPLTVTLTDTILEPEITLAKSNNLGIEELIGTGSSNYSHSSESRIHNLLLGSSKFHGVLIPKGETFSFAKIVGDISSTTGYQPAYIIKDGKTILGDGGGVCQVSTTLFRAAMNTGLPITERWAHAYRVSYYENDSQPGLDSTVYPPSIDLKFHNDTGAPILIQREVDEENHIMVFNFYGKKDARKVEISPVRTWDAVPTPPTIYQDDATLARGATRQIENAVPGLKTTFHYKVTRADGTMYEKDFSSNYRPWAAVILVGTKD